MVDINALLRGGVPAGRGDKTLMAGSSFPAASLANLAPASEGRKRAVRKSEHSDTGKEPIMQDTKNFANELQTAVSGLVLAVSGMGFVFFAAPALAKLPMLLPFL